MSSIEPVIETYTNAAGQPCHRVIGPAATIETENVRPDDQQFAHGQVGIINVTMMKDATRGRTPDRLPINEDLLNQAMANDPSEATLAAMSRERMREPVLFVDFNGLFLLVDGSHRVIKRHRNNLTWVKGFVFVNAAVAAFQCVQYATGPDGVRRQIPLENYIGGR